MLLAPCKPSAAQVHLQSCLCVSLKMAYYAALVTAMELLKDIIHRDRHPKFLRGRQRIMKSLLDKFSYLEESLHDYSSKGNEASDRVEGLIRDVAYKAQDIIEFQISTPIKSKKVMRSTLNRFPNNPVNRDLKKVKQEIDSVLGELAAIKEGWRSGNLQPNNDSASIRASEQAPSGRNTMVGFDEYLTTIKDQLCGLSTQLQVIPIVGTGGIGKTTLARNTFYDSLILYHFDYHGWVTVSQDYDVIKVLHNLLESLGLKIDRERREGEIELKQRIYKYLKGRKYVVVIDDIWSTRVWDEIKRCILPDDNNGSRVVLTTRLLGVAQYAGTCGFVQQIQFLNEKESWNLFQKKVFGQGSCPQELEDIGRSIVSKCYGLPLAIIVIAGILSNMRLPHDWKAIVENMSTILSRTDENLSRVFSLSYNHLPHQLKTCFLYLGSFPEDYEIHVSDLIQLWVAEGFLKSPNETESLEEVGEACLQGLVERNLVLITKKRANGQYKFCVMHELLRDFCRNKAFQHLFFAIDSEMLYPGGVENARRVNVHSYPAYPSIGTYPFNCCKQSKHVRSFLWFCRTYLIANFEDIKWDKYQFLRVFGLHNVEANSIQGAILQMVHLKYLRLSVSDRGLIPSFISVFQNLQTLVIHGMEFCPIILPPQIWKMTQLRHLIITTMVLAPVHLVGTIPTQKLGYMQTLMSVRDFTFTNEAIQMMPNLRKLKAFYSNYGSDHKWESHRLNNLVNLHLLEELKISSYYGPVVPRIVSIQSSFALPLSLRKLSLVRCGLPWNYMTVVGSLPNLQVLRLKDDSFMGEEWETTEGGFRSLKFLLLEWLDLKYWRADKTHFPCLEHLKIRWCSKLEMIPLEIGDISTLKFIDIYESKGIEDSAKEIQEEQEDQGNYLLQIRIGHIW